MALLDRQGKPLSQNDVMMIVKMLKGAYENHIVFSKSFAGVSVLARNFNDEYKKRIANIEKDYLNKHASSQNFSADELIDLEFINTNNVARERSKKQTGFSSLTDYVDNNIHEADFYYYHIFNKGDKSDIEVVMQEDYLEVNDKDTHEAYNHTESAFKLANEAMPGIEGVIDYNPNSDRIRSLHQPRSGNSTTLVSKDADVRNKGIFSFDSGAEFSRIKASDMMSKMAKGEDIGFGDLFDAFSSLNELARLGDSEGGKIRGINVSAGKNIHGIAPFKAPDRLYRTLDKAASYMNQIRDTQDPNLKKTRAIQVASFIYSMTLSEHVFGDGNGRSCRLLADTILQSFGLPPHIPNETIKSKAAGGTIGDDIDFNVSAQGFFEGISKSSDILKDVQAAEVLARQEREVAEAAEREREAHENHTNVKTAISVWDEVINDVTLPIGMVTLASTFKQRALDVSNPFMLKLLTRYNKDTGKVETLKLNGHKNEEGYPSPTGFTNTKQGAIDFLSELDSLLGEDDLYDYNEAEANGKNGLVFMCSNKRNTSKYKYGTYETLTYRLGDAYDIKPPALVDKPTSSMNIMHSAFGGYEAEFASYNAYLAQKAEYDRGLAEFNKKNKALEAFSEENAFIINKAKQAVNDYKSTELKINDARTIDVILADEAEKELDAQDTIDVITGRKKVVLGSSPNHREILSIELEKVEGLPMEGLALIAVNSLKINREVGDGSTQYPQELEFKKEFEYTAEDEEFRKLAEFHQSNVNIAGKVQDSLFSGKDSRMGGRFAAVIESRKQLNIAANAYRSGNKQPLIDLIRDSLPPIISNLKSQTSTVKSCSGKALIEMSDALKQLLDNDPIVKEQLHIPDEDLNNLYAASALVKEIVYPKQRQNESFKKYMKEGSEDKASYLKEMLYSSYLLNILETQVKTGMTEVGTEYADVVNEAVEKYSGNLVASGKYKYLYGRNSVSGTISNKIMEEHLKYPDIYSKFQSEEGINSVKKEFEDIIADSPEYNALLEKSRNELAEMNFSNELKNILDKNKERQKAKESAAARPQAMERNAEIQPVVQEERNNIQGQSEEFLKAKKWFDTFTAQLKDRGISFDNPMSLGLVKVVENYDGKERRRTENSKDVDGLMRSFEITQNAVSMAFMPKGSERNYRGDNYAEYLYSNMRNPEDFTEDDIIDLYRKAAAGKLIVDSPTVSDSGDVEFTFVMINDDGTSRITSPINMNNAARGMRIYQTHVNKNPDEQLSPDEKLSAFLYNEEDIEETPLTKEEENYILQAGLTIDEFKERQPMYIALPELRNPMSPLQSLELHIDRLFMTDKEQGNIVKESCQNSIKWVVMERRMMELAVKYPEWFASEEQRKLISQVTDECGKAFGAVNSGVPLQEEYPIYSFRFKNFYDEILKKAKIRGLERLPKGKLKDSDGNNVDLYDYNDAVRFYKSCVKGDKAFSLNGVRYVNNVGLNRLVRVMERGDLEAYKEFIDDFCTEFRKNNTKAAADEMLGEVTAFSSKLAEYISEDKIVSYQKLGSEFTHATEKIRNYPKQFNRDSVLDKGQVDNLVLIEKFRAAGVALDNDRPSPYEASEYSRASDAAELLRAEIIKGKDPRIVKEATETLCSNVLFNTFIKKIAARPDCFKLRQSGMDICKWYGSFLESLQNQGVDINIPLDTTRVKVAEWAGSEEDRSVELNTVLDPEDLRYSPSVIKLTETRRPLIQATVAEMYDIYLKVKAGDVVLLPPDFDLDGGGMRFVYTKDDNTVDVSAPIKVIFPKTLNDSSDDLNEEKEDLIGEYFPGMTIDDSKAFEEKLSEFEVKLITPPMELSGSDFFQYLKKKVNQTWEVDVYKDHAANPEYYGNSAMARARSKLIHDSLSAYYLRDSGEFMREGELERLNEVHKAHDLQNHDDTKKFLSSLTEKIAPELLDLKYDSNPTQKIQALLEKNLIVCDGKAYRKSDAPWDVIDKINVDLKAGKDVFFILGNPDDPSPVFERIVLDQHGKAALESELTRTYELPPLKSGTDLPEKISTLKKAHGISEERMDIRDDGQPGPSPELTECINSLEELSGESQKPGKLNEEELNSCIHKYKNAYTAVDKYLRTKPGKDESAMLTEIKQKLQSDAAALGRVRQGEASVSRLSGISASVSPLIQLRNFRNDLKAVDSKLHIDTSLYKSMDSSLNRLIADLEAGKDHKTILDDYTRLFNNSKNYAAARGKSTPSTDLGKGRLRIAKQLQTFSERYMNVLLAAEKPKKPLTKVNAPAAEKALQKKVNPEKLVESKENQLQESSENLNKEERKNVMNELPLA